MTLQEKMGVLIVCGLPRDIQASGVVLIKARKVSELTTLFLF